MARKPIDIGTVGNDGTGDSIRDSFRKVNDNFLELYSALGLGEKLTFQGLDDTPSSYAGFDRSILVVDADPDTGVQGIKFKPLVEGTGIRITQTDNEITFQSLFAAISGDDSPQLGGPLNAARGTARYPIGNLPDVRSSSELNDAISKLTTTHGVLAANSDRIAANKGYVDTKIARAGVDAIDPRTGAVNPDWGRMTGPLVLSRDPEPSDDDTYNGLVAATKRYVDSSAFGSIVNLYVATSGEDERPGVSAALQGRALAYAYRTFEAALKRAEEIMLDSRVEIGPYKKVLTYGGGVGNCVLSSISEAPDSGSGFTGATVFMSVDTIVLSSSSLDFNYRTGDVITLAVGTGTAAQVEVLAVNANGEILSFRLITPGVYSVLPGGFNIPTNAPLSAFGSGATFDVTYKVNSVSVPSGGVGTGYGLVSVRIERGPGDTTGTGAFGNADVVGGKIVSITITDQGSGFTNTPILTVNLPRFKVFTNGGNTDFTGNVSSSSASAIRTRDIRDGLYLRGEESGALAQILAHRGEIDGLDEVFDVDIKYGAFILGEVLSYGDVTKFTQISVLVESGTYEENYPLKVPQNVAIIGDEFRRVIIKPKVGISSSPWAFQNFKRDLEIDGTVTADQEFAWHYLADTSAPVYPLINNKGFYRSAAQLIALNKTFLQDEITAWIAHQISIATPGSIWRNFTYNVNLFAKDIGIILDAYTFDLRWGSYNRTVSAAIKYYENATIAVDNTTAVIEHLNVLAQQIINNTEIPTVYNSVRSQIIDFAFVAEAGSGSVITSLRDVVIDFTNSSAVGTSVPNYPKDNNDLDVFLCNDAVIIRAVTSQGHGGFMMVLDPEGQILAKSPYAQECASFSRSNGRKRFSGGMFVDGFSGNLEFEIYDKAEVGAGGFVIGNSYTIKTVGTTNFIALGASSNSVGVTFTATGTGSSGTTGVAYNNLFLKVRDLKRFPNLPASYIVNDTVYRINYVRDFVYDPAGSTASFILDETTPWTTPIFTYDSAICSRDVGLIINGLSYDVVLGTNFNQRRAGLLYRQANAQVVIDDQLSYTISAIEETHDLVNAEIPGSAYTATRSLVDISKTNIVNILRNGTIGAPALTFTNPSGLSTDKANAKTLLQANINFFRDEIVGWVDAQIVGNISPFTSAFVYDSTTFAREVQNIVEAVTYNMLYGGNDAVVNAGLSFYDGVGTAVAWQYESGAETKYVAAIDYLKGLVKNAVQNIGPGTAYSSTARVTGVSAGITVANEVEAFIATISTIVNTGTSSAGTPPSFTTYSYDSNKKLAVAEFTDPTTKANIQSAIIAYVDSIANRYEVLMPGNRSMLANDFTQVNDMGYGIVTNNGGLLEAVSVFTYYCYISYYSRNGGQIRSISGSSAHGRYALVAEGADPLEIPTPVTIYQDLGTGATVVSTGIYTNSAGGLILYINNYNFVPLNNGELEVIHTDGNVYRYSVTSVSTTDMPVGQAQLNISSTGNSTTAGLAFAIPDGTIVTVRALSQVVLTGDVVDVATRPSTALKLNETIDVYRVLQFQSYTDPDGKQNCTISVANPTLITAAAHGQLPGYIVVFASTGTLPTGLTSGIKYYVLDAGLTANTFRVSLSKNGTAVGVSAAGSGTHSFTPGGLARTTLRENYDYVELTPWSPNEYRGSTFTLDVIPTPAVGVLFTTTSAHGFSAGDVIAFSSTGTLPTGVSDGRNYFVIASGLSATEFRVSTIPGGTAIDTSGTETGTHVVGKIKGYVGDNSFAIVPLSALDKSRIIGMKVVWVGEEYVVSQYDDESTTGEPYARIYFDRPLVDDVITFSSNPTLKAGVPKRTNAASGTLTIRISLTRVTGHDLLEIGTGSYADTNYPNEIYGGAVNPLDEDAEVEERGSGRAFYVTTDQFGNFRVGPYFRVDQGTGRVTFSAAIALSNLDGLGFKRGVPISEFSPDSSMANNATDTVPTQNAVRTYIERRLGVTHDGNLITEFSQLIPPFTGGFMALNGVTTMNQDMDLGGNKIIDVDDPVLPTDAVNLQSLTWNNFQDFNGTNLDAGDIVVFTGAGNSSVNASIIGDVSFNLTTGVDSALNQIDVQITPNTIINADISSSAAIDQAKLNLDSAYATTTSTLSATATGTGAIEFLASISGTTLTVLTSGPSGTLIVPGLSITGGVVPENTYIVSNISGTGLGSTWTLNKAVTQPSALLTASQVTVTFPTQTIAPFVSGQRIVVSGLSVSGYNGVHTVTTCTTTRVTYSGTTSGSATGGAVKALRGISTYDTAQFTVTDGYVTVKENGLIMSRIQKIPTKTVLANEDAITNNVTAVAFSTIISDGGAIRKAQYSSNGFLRKVASTGVEATDYSIVEATTGAAGYAAGDANKLITRSSTGDIGARILTLDGNDGAGQGLKLKMPAESSATLTLSRTSTLSGGSTRLYGFSGNAGILIGNGSLPTDPTTYYDNEFHSFRKQDGVTPAPITASSIQVTTITAGGPTTLGSIIGRWSLSGVGSRMQATYSADLAEFYEGDKEYPVGTVLIFGGDKEVTISNSKEDHRIAGVVSDTAAYTMYGACPGHKNLIALQGRVPVRVVGKIAKGDLLVTSSVAGVAVSAGGVAKTGTVVGKALENYNSDHIGTIEVAVGRT